MFNKFGLGDFSLFMFFLYSLYSRQIWSLCFTHLQAFAFTWDYTEVLFVECVTYFTVECVVTDEIHVNFDTY